MWVKYPADYLSSLYLKVLKYVIQVVPYIFKVQQLHPATKGDGGHIVFAPYPVCYRFVTASVQHFLLCTISHLQNIFGTSEQILFKLAGILNLEHPQELIWFWCA